MINQGCCPIEPPIGCGCCNGTCCPVCKPPVSCKVSCVGPRTGGRVKLTGQIKLTCNYVDAHGHTRSFDIETGKYYVIEALSQTKGVCTITGKVVDFDSVKGIEKILTAPHIIEIGAIIVDYSTDYQANVVRIGVENILSITPMETVDDTTSTDTEETYIINDPFSENQLDENTSAAESGATEETSSTETV